MLKVMFVCHGNICRSTMAEFLLKDVARKRKLELDISSSGTSREELGNPVHRGTVKVLDNLNIDCKGKRAVQITLDDINSCDYVLAMDENNMKNLERMFGQSNIKNTKKLLYYTGNGGDVADPWYTGNFDKTYQDIMIGIEGFLKHIGMN